MSYSNKIKIAVVGVGNLGQHHSRIYNELPDVELVGVVDIDSKRVANIATKHRIKSFISYYDIIGKVDAVSIVVPTPLHFEIGRIFLQEGIHCLIEKPIAANLKEAETLLRLARKNHCILQVGHVERFNPAVIEAQKYIHNPEFIEAYRLGLFDPRVNHIGVVLDLMIHDLDIILYLVQSKIEDIDAIGTPLFTRYEDIANVRIRFSNGCVANISASRVSLKKFRKIRIFQGDSYISLDYMAQKLKIYQKKKDEIQSMKDVKVIRPRLHKGEPLKMELKHFIECIKDGKIPLVTGKHGRDALEVALDISRKICQKKF